MSTYRLTYIVPLNLVVTIEADDTDDAQDRAWEEAQEYLQTVYGNGLHVTADGDLDGIGADEVVVTENSLPDCPECAQGKHDNCDGSTWDNDADTYGDCPCEERGHGA